MVDCKICGHPYCEHAGTQRGIVIDCANYMLLQKPQTNAEVARKWIPVTERLPEHGDVVLCFMKFGEQRILQWDNVSNWWIGYGHGDDWQKADVTHWLCLPQPPKGEAND